MAWSIHIHPDIANSSKISSFSQAMVRREGNVFVGMSHCKLWRRSRCVILLTICVLDWLASFRSAVKRRFSRLTSRSPRIGFSARNRLRLTRGKSLSEAASRRSVSGNGLKVPSYE